MGKGDTVRRWCRVQGMALLVLRYMYPVGAIV